MFMQIDLPEFERRHAAAWDSDTFLKNVEANLGRAVPDAATWGEIGPTLPPVGRILEIGAGTGHLIAAAKAEGRDVAVVETSELHRRYIADVWGIDCIYDSLDRVPDGRQYSGAIMVNILEHLYHPVAFLSAVARLMVPGGVIYVSTCNARALVAALCGTMWSMCKQPDHVSIPSAEGMRRAADRAGLLLSRVWTHELPFETPIGIAVALRDWRSERRCRTGEAPAEAPAGDSGRQTTAGHRLLDISRRCRGLDFVTPVTSRLGVASTIKARLVVNA